MTPALCVLLYLVSETGAKSRFDPNKVVMKAHAPVYDTWNFTLDGMFVSGLQELSACRRDLRALEREAAHLETRGQAEGGTAASPECPEPPPVNNAIVTRDGNEAWYSCKDNFRFRGISQSASCRADGEWKFFSNSLGVCSPTV
ncbi:uncharacterized protein LOC124262877 [Haliotis rubra]|uniref:uncharacterized protein LOC124262877 n=1 Tax=Haliotis rubra TaxID=36100 RepID=UPI001EE57E10|nr:uncharacterized protein LOC124262877 [Haliotis rubra]